ncbi:MAG: hypothetical protein U1E52_14030 [Geminicoccaceae bacterium]
MTATIVTLGAPTRRSDAGFLSLLADWRRRRRYRAELRRLLRTGPYLIEDIGLAIPTAAREAALPFWR